MPDFQQAWYLNLLFRAWLNSDNPGYLPNDPDELWRLANARTRRFFQREGDAVTACFQATEDGKWLFNIKLLEVYEDQLKKWKGKRAREPLAAPSLTSLFDFALESKTTTPEVCNMRVTGDANCDDCKRSPVGICWTHYRVETKAARGATA